jgi:hypothetical protein
VCESEVIVGEKCIFVFLVLYFVEVNSEGRFGLLSFMAMGAGLELLLYLNLKVFDIKNSSLKD